MEALISYSLRARILVVLGLLAVIGFGLYAYQRMPVDAFPDISPVMVPVFAEAHGMAPEEIERLITYPIEASMSGLPDVTQIKSTSAFGMAVIYVYFKDSVNIYFARQLVNERLTAAMKDLPEMHDPPALGPISTGLGQVFLYYLTMDPGTDTQGKPAGAYLRELNDWLVKYQLQTVPGVTDVLSMGGHVLQFQIRVDPQALLKYQLDLHAVTEAVNQANRNVGGQFLILGSEEYLVRGLGLLSTLDDVSRIRIKTVGGVSITVGDIADVQYGEEVRRGVVTRNGEGEVVSGIVMKLYGENTSLVIDRLHAKVAQLQSALPPGVHLAPYYEQSELVRQATTTVKRALLIGAILVIVTLTVFLGNIRTAFIVAIALPFCALIAVLVMGWAGVSANLMSLGGIAIGIGMLGDGAIVMVENIYRHLSGERTSTETRDRVILEAAQEVARPIVFSIAIIIMVFLPIFTLQEVEGKMFAPMASAITAALVGSIIAAIVIAPALAHYLLRHGPTREFVVLRILRKMYVPVLSLALRFRKTTILSSLAAFAAAMMLVPRLGTEFVPTLEEGSILIGVTMAPSTSLEKGTATIQSMERVIMQFPEVREVVSRIGRPEAGSHPHPVNYAEIHIELNPIDQWAIYTNKAELVKEIEHRLAGFGGIMLNFTQPIQNAFDELLSGVRAQVAIKLYGEDLTVLRETAQEIEAAVSHVPGLVDLSVEQSHGQPQVLIVPDRPACARYGINVDSVLELVELAVGGEAIDTIYLGARRFALHLRYQEPYRDTTAALENLVLTAADGSLVPLAQVAEVKTHFGAIQINRENNQRRWIIQGNVRGRDLGSVIADIQQAVAEDISLPPGYFIEYGGQFENQQRAMKRLLIIIPIVLGVVLILLGLTFGTVRHALMIILNVPLALIGGVVGLFLMGEYLSVPASVGFIALFGIAVQNGMVMVSCFNQRAGTDQAGVLDSVRQGAILRLRPVLMTAVTTILGLLPLLLSHGTGSEVQRPLATVVVFGLTTSTLLTLVVIPAVYAEVELRRLRRNGHNRPTSPAS
ncbi:MAG: efflux RND transporter permease subunit [Planctomycetes bacterium]|nr:efflux RND transporter permease subunit [Planctomycetota bacterium]NOG55754.1 efflux RND transporter permease subunit [Planctomycetota bacterium]